MSTTSGRPCAAPRSARATSHPRTSRRWRAPRRTRSRPPPRPHREAPGVDPELDAARTRGARAPRARRPARRLVRAGGWIPRASPRQLPRAPRRAGSPPRRELPRSWLLDILRQRHDLQGDPQPPLGALAAARAAAAGAARRRPRRSAGATPRAARRGCAPGPAAGRFATAIRVAAATASTSAGIVSTARSCTSTATRSPSLSIGVTARSGPGSAQGERPARLVDVAALRAEPVAELQRAVAESARQAIAQRHRLPQLAEVDHQAGHRALRPAPAQQVGQQPERDADRARPRTPTASPRRRPIPRAAATRRSRRPRRPRSPRPSRRHAPAAAARSRPDREHGRRAGDAAQSTSVAIALCPSGSIAPSRYAAATTAGGQPTRQTAARDRRAGACTSGPRWRYSARRHELPRNHATPAAPAAARRLRPRRSHAHDRRSR